MCVYVVALQNINVMMIPSEFEGYVDVMMIPGEFEGYVEVVMIPGEFIGYVDVIMIVGEPRGYVDVMIMPGGFGRGKEFMMPCGENLHKCMNICEVRPCRDKPLV